MFSGDDAATERFLATVCTPDWTLSPDRGRPWAEAIAELSAGHPGAADLIAAYRTRWPEMLGGAIDGTVWSADTWNYGRDRFAFLALFRGILVSGAERLAKPDPAIFHLFADRYGLDLANCVFIDDNMKNAEAARALGMGAIRFENPVQLRQELGKLGLCEPT